MLDRSDYKTRSYAKHNNTAHVSNIQLQCYFLSIFVLLDRHKLWPIFLLIFKAEVPYSTETGIFSASPVQSHIKTRIQVGLQNLIFISHKSISFCEVGKSGTITVSHRLNNFLRLQKLPHSGSQANFVLSGSGSLQLPVRFRNFSVSIVASVSAALFSSINSDPASAVAQSCNLCLNCFFFKFI